jgi:hypothetical protein
LGNDYEVVAVSSDEKEMHGIHEKEDIHIIALKLTRTVSPILESGVFDGIIIFVQTIKRTWLFIILPII